MLWRRSPFFLPGNIHGLPGTRERPASTLAAAGGSGTTRAPVLLSANRISPASKYRSSHRSPRTSFRRHPVSTSNRIAAAAWVDASRSAGSRVQGPTEPIEFHVSQEPLVVLLHLVAAREPAGIPA